MMQVSTHMSELLRRNQWEDNWMNWKEVLAAPLVLQEMSQDALEIAILLAGSYELLYALQVEAASPAVQNWKDCH